MPYNQKQVLEELKTFIETSLELQSIEIFYVEDLPEAFAEENKSIANQAAPGLPTISFA